MDVVSELRRRRALEEMSNKMQHKKVRSSRWRFFKVKKEVAFHNIWLM
jgi:hypothetical protein